MAYSSYAGRERSIDRRTKMAQLLRDQALTQNEGQMVSGRYVAPSWTQGLSRLLAAGLSAREMQGATKDQDALDLERKSALAAAIGGYSKTGDPTALLGNEDTMQFGMKAITDRKAAEAKALAAGPKSREVMMGNEKVTQEYDPKTRTWAEVGRGAAFAPAQDQASSSARDYRLAHPEDPEMTGFEAYQMKMKAAGRPSTNVMVNMPKDALNAFNKPLAAQFDAGMTKAQSSVDTVNSIANMRDQLAGGMYTGSGASAKAGFVDFMTNGLGLPFDQTKLTNTRSFTSAAGQQLLAHAKALGANPSNADASRIAEIVGNIGTDPAALQKVMDWTEEQARKSILVHNARVEQVRGSAESSGLPSPFMYDPTVPLPPAWAPKGQPRTTSQNQTPGGMPIDAVTTLTPSEQEELVRLRAQLKGRAP